MEMLNTGAAFTDNATLDEQLNLPESPSPVTHITERVLWDDATWILTSSFIIFTMQSGFGLLEAGCVSAKNEVNIMVKNVVDVVFGGITYWAFGFGISFGKDSGSNGFNGVGYFLLNVDGDDMGIVFSLFVFQLSFATTATTIVSGAMAERTKLSSYIVFSLLNTIVYCFPAHWIWCDFGFLKKMGVVDIAGSGAVHMVGGVSALVGTLMLGPRLGRFKEGAEQPEMGNPANVLVGLFMLWWGWLGFNCGSTFGISFGKWILASKAAVTTLNASMAGGAVGILGSFCLQKRMFKIDYIVNSILGGLVAITAGCALVRPWEALIIGAIGGILAIAGDALMVKLKIDDPVGAVAVHGIAGMWGMLSCGLFVDIDTITDMSAGQRGLFYGGGFYLLGIQLLACVCIIAWSALVSFLLLLGLKFTIGLRVSPEEERLGADFVEHGIKGPIDPTVQPSAFFRKRSVVSRKSSGQSQKGPGVPQKPPIQIMDTPIWEIDDEPDSVSMPGSTTWDRNTSTRSSFISTLGENNNSTSCTSSIRRQPNGHSTRRGSMLQISEHPQQNVSFGVSLSYI